MLVRCDVCGAEPAAVLCCADEAALCSACDTRVHRANKLADKHRRIPLIHPSGDDSAAAAPLCDVCKERRGLVFCVEDRAILCADCDDPIHSANDLTAKHSRFLLVGAKLSAALVDQAPPSPDDCRGSGSDELHDVAAVCAPQAQGSCTAKSLALDCSNSYGGGGGGSSISDYLTNICPGWRVDDLLFDDAAFSAASEDRCDEHEQVPSLDADLFDVIAGRQGKRGALYGGAMGLEKVPAAASIAVPTAAKQQGRVRERHWSCDSDSDVFAVPEISLQPPAKKARPPAPTFWCF
ncbi:hypothetical protein PAHAL_4G016600 [Panicum hallii]|uniref:B box-type domain-containing protein n=1 Tax=Panicum hallii TaxID=206008 RepID=A0A2S3HGD1_9POAL|nr:B-box zinc finger protein 20-like [Panicum hallii]PAN22392.1 hypothetical protein PAHAL_4G016600 [Panicum hallii]